MKKAQKWTREFDKLKSSLKQTDEVVRHTKNGNLWNHEANVRKKIKALNGLRDKQLHGFDAVYEGYLKLLDEISIRLVAHYNKKNGTDYQFEEIVKKDRAGYIASGIISVLITSHIPDLIADEFTKYFPANPKDEYEKARKMKRSIILHLGATNTGKTYLAVERLMQAESGVYLAPLRILALENYEKLNKLGVPCHLITGEEELLVEGASHVCSTVEKADLDKVYDVAVIDEIQMIADSGRGESWTRALLGLRCNEIHVCGALNAKDLIVKILEDCGDVFQIKEYERQTPLEVITEPFALKDAVEGDALVAFSKRRVLELSKYFLEREIKNSVIYGDLPPEVRRMQYQAFLDGTSRILVTTDAIGMGVNLPIRRIIFMSLQKFDGYEVRLLSSQEVKQIGGRAGRKGIYDVGYVGTTSTDWDFLQESLEIPDDPLMRAVIGPSEAITRIAGLPLNEKLALWSTKHEQLDCYRKMDIRDFLLILESIKHFMLPETIQYKLMKLPFDVNDPEVLGCFLNFVAEYFKKDGGTISKPHPAGSLLSDYERYYQKLNLYYSFCKNFNLELDKDWVYQQRAKVSKKINNLLLQL